MLIILKIRLIILLISPFFIVNGIDSKPELQKIDLEWFQSNHEGKIIDKLHYCVGKKNAIIINPGALKAPPTAIANSRPKLKRIYLINFDFSENVSDLTRR